MNSKETWRLNTQSLVKQIEKMTRERMAQHQVVSLSEFHRLNKKKQERVILVIEDDLSLQKAMKRILEREEYKVLLASDASELAGLIDDSPIDLILMDVGLPWLDGYELARLMKDHHQLKDIPLVFVSARTSPEDIKQGFEVGADDYITKPFDIEKLKKTLRTLIKIAHE